jgi:hypothetical protein
MWDQLEAQLRQGAVTASPIQRKKSTWLSR